MSETKTQKERLLEFIKYLNLSVNKFEKQAGFSTGNIPHMSDNVPVKAQQKILSAFPELNLTWLLTGVGEMLNTPKESEEDQIRFSISSDADIDLRAKLALREQECRLMQSNIDALREIIQTQKMTIQLLNDQIELLKRH